MTQAAPLTLDVRPALRAGGEPFAQIMQAVASLKPSQALRLLATFEPVPLYAVLGRKGFAHRALRHAEGDWEVLFSPDAGASVEPLRKPQRSAPIHAGVGAGWPEPSEVLDNRGLQPPEPMVRILATLETLAPGQVLEAWNDREPLHLYPELEARGAAIDVCCEPDRVRVLIRRGS